MKSAGQWIAASMLAWCGALAAQAPETVEVEVQPVASGVWMLVGRGGNVGLAAGPDGAFMIDDQYAPMTEPLLEAIASVTDESVRFVLNTHWHGDHTGGNENFGELGSVIVAHDNVRTRMASGQLIDFLDVRADPAAPGALPVVTFDNTTTFHMNGETIHAFHVPRAHTDGDVVIHFRRANVFHMGDTFFNGYYPFIDLSSGGSVYGVIDAAERVLALADDETRIIPGHGELSDRATLAAYRDMLKTITGRVERLIGDGASRREVIDARVTADFDEKWGGSLFMPPERWITLVYDSVARRREGG